MAIFVGIESLLSGRTVEWARVEYKAVWDPSTSLKTICAFANDIDNWGTGYLVIGVEEENGRPKLPVRGVSNRHYRNRRIGEFLKEIHLTEGRNTGFRKILAALESNGSPLPEFETDDERSYFISRLFRHPAFAGADGNATQTFSDKISDKISDKVAEHRQTVVDALALGPGKTNDLAEMLGLKPARMRQLLSDMVRDGIIEAHGERRGRYYCLPESERVPDDSHVEGTSADD